MDVTVETSTLPLPLETSVRDAVRLLVVIVLAPPMIVFCFAASAVPVAVLIGLLRSLVLLTFPRPIDAAVTPTREAEN